MNPDVLVSSPTEIRHGIARADTQNWKKPAFLGLLAAQFISLAGTYLILIAIPWMVLELTDSPSMMTLVILAMVIPGGVIGIPAGALVDRLNTRSLLIALDRDHTLCL